MRNFCAIFCNISPTFASVMMHLFSIKPSFLGIAQHLRMLYLCTRNTKILKLSLEILFQDNNNEHRTTHQELAPVTILPHGRHRPCLLHPLLHPLLCPDAPPHQHHSQGHPLDRPLRHGQDLPIRRSRHSRSRRLQTSQEQDIFQTLSRLLPTIWETEGDKKTSI